MYLFLFIKIKSTWGPMFERPAVMAMASPGFKLEILTPNAFPVAPLRSSRSCYAHRPFWFLFEQKYEKKNKRAKTFLVLPELNVKQPFIQFLEEPPSCFFVVSNIFSASVIYHCFLRNHFFPYLMLV